MVREIFYGFVLKDCSTQYRHHLDISNTLQSTQALVALSQSICSMSGRSQVQFWLSQTKDYKLVVEAPLSNGFNAQHIQGSSMQKVIDPFHDCQNNVMCPDRISNECACMQCDISVRQHYKVVIIPSIRSTHHSDIT